MTPPPIETLVIGAGGLLGAALTRVDSPQVIPVPCQGIAWNSGAALGQLTNAVTDFRLARPDRSAAVIWCAGAGVIGTGPEQLAAETEAFATMLDALPSGDVLVFLASSAGGVYGGQRASPITEASPTVPLADYGRNKLVQERLLTDWAHATGGRGVIGRIANLYGPGQVLAKPQGLISQTCFATLTRQPISIYVPLDTIRDYLYVDDAAALVNSCVERCSELPAGTVITKILASGRSVTIGSVLAEVHRVLRRRPSVVMAASPKRHLQGAAMQFHSTVWTDLDRSTRTTLPDGVHRTSQALIARLGAVGLKSADGSRPPRA